MKHTILILIASSIIFSCSNEEINTYIIPEDKLIPMLCDFHIVDAASKQGAISNNRNNFIRHSHYNGILLNYNIERARFDSTIQYYAARPDEHKRLYEKIEAKLIDKLEQNQID